MKNYVNTQLTDEIAELSKKQSAALEAATYLPMSKAEAKAFDERCDRMEQIRLMLSHQASEQ